MRSEVWRPASRLVTAPREVRGPARQALRPGCEELAARAAEEMLQTEARPPAVNRQGGAPRGERPASWGASRSQARQQRHAPVGAPPPLVFFREEGGKRDQPGRQRVAGTRR